MIVDTSRKILVVGLGLMGGSYCRALKRYGFEISAITRSASSVEYALKEGMIDRGAAEPLPELISDADIIIFALYPHIFVEWVEKYRGLIKPGALITDVTGVKSPVVYRIQSLLAGRAEFIASHPMAGREVYGVRNSSTRMFAGANFIVTPTENNTEEAVESCMELGRLLGFENVSVLSPEEHDEMIGFVSQLTHCIAVTLMTCNESPHIERYTGDSFRDLTRIARINDEMWSELFMLNKDALLKQMELFGSEFERMKKLIKDGDTEGLREMMRKSTARRAAFDKK